MTQGGVYREGSLSTTWQMARSPGHRTTGDSRFAARLDFSEAGLRTVIAHPRGWVFRAAEGWERQGNMADPHWTEPLSLGMH